MSELDYEIDIFALLVDLVERPSSPSCDLCLFIYIILSVLCLNTVLLCGLLFAFKRIRFQYSVGNAI